MKIPRSFLFASFGFLLFSCSKKSSTPVKPVQVCQIVSASQIQNSNQTDFTFTYNSDGKISTEVVSGPYGYTKTFTYKDKNIYIATAAGVNSSTDTVTLNDAGMVILDKEVTNNAVYKITYSYNAAGELQTYTEQQDNYPPVSAVYTFSNGDATQIVSGQLTDTVGFDMNKLSTSGDITRFSQLLSFGGALYLNNKHLVISTKDGVNNIKYNYSFDSDGKITSVNTVNGNSTSTINYTYSCK
jgi:hypothetical protein